MYLLEYRYKKSLRKFFKKNNINKKSHSSIYKFANRTFIIVDVASLMMLEDIKIININTPILEYIYQWGLNEIYANIEFLQYENKTILKDNGREIIIYGASIIRSFEYLTEIFLIVNYTHNSFYDGGKYLNSDVLLAHIEKQIQLGITYIDLGVCATNVNAVKISALDEIKLLQQILPLINYYKAKFNVSISIDTYNLETMQYLLDQDVDLINDVSGDASVDVVKQIIANNKYYLGMHKLSVPVKKNEYIDIKADPITYIIDWMHYKISQFLKHAINLDYIILDPGLGFGMLPIQAWHIIKNIDQFANLPCELLVGHSNKSFLTYVTQLEAQKRDLHSAVVGMELINKVDYLRMHDLYYLNQMHTIKHQLN